jgi:anaerobic selenocysteine-containing dehydrogenase
MATRTAYRTCPLCEATCGLRIELDGDRVVSVRGDDADVLSGGFICPKGVALGELHTDPDRLRTPLVRRDGKLTPSSWDDAFDEVARRMRPLLDDHGRDAVGVYLGNPNVHNLSQLYLPVLIRALGTAYRWSASTLDQWPKQLASGLMFGTPMTVAVPDVDRTDLLLVFGANPMVSNGSLWTAPDMPGRLRALRARGGRLIVIDPRRSRTAQAADQHIPIRPGTDALLLAALVGVLGAEGRIDLGDAAPHVEDLDVETVLAALAPFTPEAVEGPTGVPAATVRQLALDLADADHAAVYGRMGTTTTAFGTTASWLVDVLNTVTGNLDRAGGVMFPLPAHGSLNTSGTPGRGRGVRPHGERRTRVRGLPNVLGEFPTSTLAEEIEGIAGTEGTEETTGPVPGDERIRGLIIVAGNPVLSAPDGARLAAALDGLELLVCVDAYLNETTLHADVVLPAPSPLARSHYDWTLTSFMVRNVAHYSPPAVPLPNGVLDEWEVLLRLAGIAAGWPGTPAAWDDAVAAQAAERAVRDPASALHGLDAGDVLASLAPRRGPERLLDLALRAGPHGDGRRGLSLGVLEAAPHGLDLGPLTPRLPEVLRTPSGRVELAPPTLVADLERLQLRLRVDAPTSTPTPSPSGSALPSERPAAPEPSDRSTSPGLLLVGRRDLRSNNSWMHNLPLLVKGRDRCTLHVHPADADRAGLTDGSPACIVSHTGSVVAPVQVTDTVAEGVVSLPHGWGHDAPDTRQHVATAHPGVNVNLLVGTEDMDPMSGTAVLNGIPVTVTPAASSHQG